MAEVVSQRVETVFTVVDEASSASAALARSFKTLEAGAKQAQAAASFHGAVGGIHEAAVAATNARAGMHQAYTGGMFDSAFASPAAHPAAASGSLQKAYADLEHKLFTEAALSGKLAEHEARSGMALGELVDARGEENIMARRSAAAEAQAIQEQRRAMMEKKRVEGLRQWAAGEAIEVESLASSIALKGAMMLSGGMSKATEHVLGLGAMASQVGLALSKEGGKVGKLGGHMMKLGPLSEAFGAGMEVGTALFDALDTDLGDASTSTALFGNEIAKSMAGAEKVGITRDELARQQGFHSAAEKVATMGVHAAMSSQLKLQAAVDKQAASLGVLKTGASAKEREQYINKFGKAMLAAADEAGVSAQQMGLVAQMLEAAAPAGLAAQAEAFIKQGAGNRAMEVAAKEAAKGLRQLPINPTITQLQNFDSGLSGAAIQLASMSNGLRSVEQAATEIEKAFDSRKDVIAENLRRDVTADRETAAAAKAAGRTANLMRGMGGAAMGDEAKIIAAQNILRRQQMLGIRSRADTSALATIYGAISSESQKRDVTKNNFDFRNSNFDITNKFAEGFDPDRIAVAFANGLAELGERAVSSGLVSPFAVR